MSMKNKHLGGEYICQEIQIVIICVSKKLFSFFKQPSEDLSLWEPSLDGKGSERLGAYHCPYLLITQLRFQPSSDVRPHVLNHCRAWNDCSLLAHQTNKYQNVPNSPASLVVYHISTSVQIQPKIHVNVNKKKVTVKPIKNFPQTQATLSLKVARVLSILRE